MVDLVDEMCWEHKDCGFEIKESDISKGEFIGFASVYDNVDLGGDVVRPGAFTHTLRMNGGEVPLLWSHNTQLPIGAAKLQDHEKGLKVFGKVAIDTPTGSWVHRLMHPIAADFKKPAIRGLSFGYDVIKHDIEGETRVLKEVKLYEVSPVVFPMNPRATITTVKADKRPMVVQTLVFSKEVFKSADDATAWATDHDYSAGKGVDETEDSYRIRQRDPGDFDQKTFRTIDITKGVKSVVGKLKNKSTQMEEQINFLIEAVKDMRKDFSEFKASLIDQGFVEDPDMFQSLRLLQTIIPGMQGRDPLFDDRNSLDPATEQSLQELLRDANQLAGGQKP